MKSPLLTLLVVVLSLTSTSAGRVRTNGAQVTLQNRIDKTLDLYVDGGYGCRALMNLTCTTSINAGPHNLEARSGQEVIASQGMTAAEGSSPVWTVCYIDPKTGRCPGE